MNRSFLAEGTSSGLQKKDTFLLEKEEGRIGAFGRLPEEGKDFSPPLAGEMNSLSLASSP